VSFRGGSIAADPRGRILAEGGDGPGLIHVELDLAAADANHVVDS
jgi:predicted amidohydrolase